MTVVLENVTRIVGAVPHISDVSLAFEPGTLNVLLGPTLSGKTSLMRLMAGLDAPTSGRVVVTARTSRASTSASATSPWSTSSSSTIRR